jgi:hypothetical protein
MRYLYFLVTWSMPPPPPPLPLCALHPGSRGKIGRAARRNHGDILQVGTVGQGKGYLNVSLSSLMASSCNKEKKEASRGSLTWLCTRVTDWRRGQELARSVRPRQEAPGGSCDKAFVEAVTDTVVIIQQELLYISALHHSSDATRPDIARRLLLCNAFHSISAMKFAGVKTVTCCLKGTYSHVLW